LPEQRLADVEDLSFSKTSSKTDVVQRAFPLLSLIAIIMTWAIGWIHLRGDIVSRPKRSLSFTSIFREHFFARLVFPSCGGISLRSVMRRRANSPEV
jgi:hypothetical protein